MIYTVQAISSKYMPSQELTEIQQYPILENNNYTALEQAMLSPMGVGTQLVENFCTFWCEIDYAKSLRMLSYLLEDQTRAHISLI